MKKYRNLRLRLAAFILACMLLAPAWAGAYYIDDLDFLDNPGVTELDTNPLLSTDSSGFLCSSVTVYYLGAETGSKINLTNAAGESVFDHNYPDDSDETPLGSSATLTLGDETKFNYWKTRRNGSLYLKSSAWWGDDPKFESTSREVGIRMFGMDYNTFDAITDSSITGLDPNSTYYIFAFEDGNDGAFDDMVVALECPNGGNSSVPIPGAVWLLGSGLLGLAGVRRRKKENEL